MDRLAAIGVLFAATAAHADPFLTTDVIDASVDLCVYANSTMGVAKETAVVVDSVRGSATYGFRICKEDTAPWPLGPNAVSFAFKRSSDGAFGPALAVTINKPSPAVVSNIALVSGAAAPAPSPAPAPTPSPPAPPPAPAPAPGVATTYEAEAGTVGGGATIQSVAAASGGKDAQDINAVGSFVQVTVDGGTGGAASLVIRYANGYGANRSLSLYVNGVKQRQVTFAKTASWATFADQPAIAIPLLPGANLIKLQRDAADVLSVDIDRLVVTR